MAGVGVSLLVFRPVRLGVCLNPGRLGLELAPPVVPRTGIVLFSSGLVWSTGLLERTVTTVRIVYKNYFSLTSSADSHYPLQQLQELQVLPA